MTEYADPSMLYAMARQLQGTSEPGDPQFTLEDIGREMGRVVAQAVSVGRVNPGLVTPSAMWPDDGEVNLWMHKESSSFGEAVMELADKYEALVTNNLPRWQDGHFIRHMDSFYDDFVLIAERWLKPKWLGEEQS